MGVPRYLDVFKNKTPQNLFIQFLIFWHYSKWIGIFGLDNNIRAILIRIQNNLKLTLFFENKLNF